jgi:hypothetical protein
MTDYHEPMRMRLIWLAVLVWGVFPALTIGCGSHPTRSSAVEIDLADAPMLFQQDVRSSFDASYYVAYDLRVEFEGKTEHCTVKWWKDGTERQRFDMCPPLVYGDDFESEPWRILMFGDREQILVCSPRLPLDPYGELDSVSGSGACHEDSSGIGDLAGNAVYFLGFPLEYPDTLPDGYFDRISEIEFEEIRTQTYADQAARCYVISASVDGEVERRETCYADNGAEVRRSSSGSDVYFDYSLTATEIGPVSSADFDPPYPYVDASVVND